MPSHFSKGLNREPLAAHGHFGMSKKSVDTTTRNPMLLFLLFGLFLLRYAQRTFLSLLLNAPPRNTR
jgi:hypothetical protein